MFVPEYIFLIFSFEAFSQCPKCCLPVSAHFVERLKLTFFATCKIAYTAEKRMCVNQADTCTANAYPRNIFQLPSRYEYLT